MTLLLTNDDGILAPGLSTLSDVASLWGQPVIVAPRHEQSGMSHRVTDKQPLHVDLVADGRHSVDGTPADCVRLGLLHLAPSTQWLLSGINAGGNLGSDVYMSGTVAAAREAALFGVRAVALSQYRSSRDRPLDWDLTRRRAEQVLQQLLDVPLEPGEFWNVNFPDTEPGAAEPQVVFCPVDPGHHAVQYEQTDAGYIYRGRYQERHREPGCDVDVCFSGNIAVTRLSTRLNAAT